MQTVMVLGLFFLSGFASLVLEVTWTRQIGLLFGHTVQASSIVLGAYFFGMTLGYLLAKRLITTKHPLRFYGACELVAGLWALVIPLILGHTSLAGIRDIFLGQNSILVQSFLRALFAFVLLLPATVAMGASLPFIAAFMDQHTKELSARRITLAYAINTLGAVTGTIAVTFLLIGNIGITGSSQIGSGAALIVGVVAIALSRQVNRAPETPATEWNVTNSNRVGWQRYTLAAISGFATLGLQVAFARMFSLVLHNSVYSFGTVLTAFLLSLSLASILFSKGRSYLGQHSVMATLQQTGGIAVATALLAFLMITDLSYFGSVGNFYTYMASCAALALGIIVIPVAVCGMLLPWTWFDTTKTSFAGDLSKLTAVNTAAAVSGALVTCFVLLPTVGLWTSFGLIASLYVASGWIIQSMTEKTVDSTRNKISALAFPAFALVFIWSAVGSVAGDYLGDEEGDLVTRFESAYGWVDVIETDNNGLKLRQNIHYGLGSSSSMTMEKRQGHLPLFLHPNPEQVLFIGLATGITSSSALDHPSIRNIDIVELVPDVAKAARSFATFNNNILSHERTNLYINDGRHFLTHHHRNLSHPGYDVIISDLFVPWESMTGYLYTVEHYEAAAKQLRPGGLFAQWLPLWQVSAKEFEIIADSFASVFPYASLFYGKNHHHWTIIGFVGSMEPLTIDREGLTKRLVSHPNFSNRMAERAWFASPDSLLQTYIGRWERGSSPLNTDNFPRVEFSTPISAWTKDQRLRLSTLSNYRHDVLQKLPGGSLFINGRLPDMTDLHDNQNQEFTQSR